MYSDSDVASIRSPCDKRMGDRLCVLCCAVLFCECVSVCVCVWPRPTVHVMSDLTRAAVGPSGWTGSRGTSEQQYAAEQMSS